MQIKITMKCHLMPVRMAIIKKNTNKKWYQRCGQKGIFVHCWWECKLAQSLWKTVGTFPRKLKLNCVTKHSTPGYISENNNNNN